MLFVQAKENKDRGMIIKIDMANLFDIVRHSFLFDVLFKFGSCSSFIGLVSTCINNPWISPLINGRPASFFKESQGLRQVHIIIVESLS
jgi:hypothetical protein